MSLTLNETIFNNFQLNGAKIFLKTFSLHLIGNCSKSAQLMSGTLEKSPHFTRERIHLCLAYTACNYSLKKRFVKSFIIPQLYALLILNCWILTILHIRTFVQIFKTGITDQNYFVFIVFIRKVQILQVSDTYALRIYIVCFCLLYPRVTFKVKD